MKPARWMWLLLIVGCGRGVAAPVERACYWRVDTIRGDRGIPVGMVKDWHCDGRLR